MKLNLSQEMSYLHVISLIAEFFNKENVSFVTAFICWEKYYPVLTVALSTLGMRLNILTPSDVEVLLENPQYYTVGVVVDIRCNGTQQLLQMASEEKLFNNMHFWLMLDENAFSVSQNNNFYNKYDMSAEIVAKKKLIEEKLFLNKSDAGVVWEQIDATSLLPQNGWVLIGVLEVLLDSQMTWVTSKHTAFFLLDLYKPSIRQPLNVTLTAVASLAPGREVKMWWREMEIPSRRRKNLNGELKMTGMVILYPEHFNDMEDMEDPTKRHIDTWTKITYPVFQNLAQDMNFSMNVSHVDSYGWQVNGSFDGLVGLVQRGEIEILASAVFIRADRMVLLNFAAETFSLSPLVIFRQPSLSTVANIFVLPFNGQVWLSCAGLFLIATVTLGIQLKLTNRHFLEREMKHVTSADIATFMVCAVCQQGYHMSPTSLSSRTTAFVTFLASLFFFTSFAANIVALLQTPSTSIKNVADLLTSPLTLGIQDVMYNRIYLTESTDPVIRSLYRVKLSHQGESAFYKNVSKGVQRIREGMFAFQVDKNMGFKEISDTFADREKCGLMQMEMFPLPVLTIAVGKDSPLREVFAVRGRWQREVGILDQLEKKWLAQKPRCENKMSGFVSVGLVEFYPALHILQYGIMAALAVFLAELVFFHRGIMTRWFSHPGRQESISGHQHQPWSMPYVKTMQQLAN